MCNIDYGATYFSICIPQYNRTDFLIEAIKSFQIQDFQGFELCISDGGSTDGGLPRLQSFLEDSGLKYVLSRSDKNLRYDENLRKSISLSQGKFIILMGNDDALANSNTLLFLQSILERFQPVSVAITNYQELPSFVPFRRMLQTKVLGKGPQTAAETFRNYAFVSGIILEGGAARSSATEFCDGSEMYQMYLGAKLISSGGRFLSIDEICVNKDIQIPGQVVDSYRSRPKLSPCPAVDIPLPMGRILETVAHGVQKGVSGRSPRDNAVFKVALQIYIFTYPYWIFEYRRVQSFNFALGMYKALRPSLTTQRAKLPIQKYFIIWFLYLIVGIVSFVVPIRLFDRYKEKLYEIAKRGSKKNTINEIS